MKRLLPTAVLTLLFLLFAAVPARALAPLGRVSVSIRDAAGTYGPRRSLPAVRVLLNGSALTGDVPGVLLDDRTLAPLRLVAEALGAQVNWVQARHQAVVTRGGDTIVLTPGSATAQVNGVPREMPGGVAPALIDRDGQTYTMVPLRFFSEALGCRVGWLPGSNTASITAPNLPQGSLAEGLNAPKNPGRYLIALDAGHGGSASGAYYEGVAEKDLNLAITYRLKAILEAQGYRTLMTRSGDEDVSLSARARKANAAKADLFVSIHCNAAVNSPKFQGLYVYHYPGSATGRALAQAIQTPACGFSGAVDRGVASADFAVVRETHMPAVLVESGFMTSSEELRWLRSEAFQANLARGIAQGIGDYLAG